MNKKIYLFLFVFLIGLISVNAYNITLREGYNISSAQLIRQVSVLIPQDIEFNNNGTKLFIASSSSDSIDEYNSSSYSISSLILNNQLSVSGLDSNIGSITFNNNGTKLYFFGTDSQKIYVYNLSLSYNLNSSVYDKSHTLAVGGTKGTLVFNNNGSKMFVGDVSNDNILEYNLTSPYNLDTNVYDKSYYVGDKIDYIRDITFNNNGTMMFVGGDTKIIGYSLSIVYNVNTSIYNNEVSIGTTGITFDNIGNKLFTVDDTFGSRYINEYDLTPKLIINYSLSASSGVFGESSDIVLNLSRGVNQSYNSAVLVYNGVICYINASSKTFFQAVGVIDGYSLIGANGYLGTEFDELSFDWGVMGYFISFILLVISAFAFAKFPSLSVLFFTFVFGLCALVNLIFNNMVAMGIFIGLGTISFFLAKIPSNSGMNSG